MNVRKYVFIVLCLTSSVAYSMSSQPRQIEVDAVRCELDLVSQAILIRKGKEENVARGYWPADVTVSFLSLHKVIEDANKNDSRYINNPRYAVSLIGRFEQIDMVGRWWIRRDTTGTYLKDELVALGVNVPS